MAECSGHGRPTYRDIARLAGTSQATVSLVLNNRDTKVGISAATRQAVLAAARQLGYTLDLGARRLRHRESGAAAPEITLAILRPAGTPVGLTARLIEAATAALAQHAPSAQLVIEEYQPDRLREHPGLSVASRFHGAILTSLTP
ncbi:MAG: LacI family DNA-binding transcriptional regulator, partial [Chloroflexi bacterium]|nr:LacI family DNA-binding transcriptional regulator [Chloroflexota bacterium]